MQHGSDTTKPTTTDRRAQVRTLDGMRPADAVGYVAGSNLPGYLPEADSVVFASAANALEFMAGEVGDYVETLGDWDVLADAEVVRGSVADGDAAHLLADHGAVEFLAGDDHGFGGRVFFVHARAVDVVGEPEA